MGEVVVDGDAMTGGLVVGGTVCWGEVERGEGRMVCLAVDGVTGRVLGGVVVVGGSVEVVVEEVVVDVVVVVVEAACNRTPSLAIRWGTPAMPTPKRTPGTTTASAR